MGRSGGARRSRTRSFWGLLRAHNNFRPPSGPSSALSAPPCRRTPPGIGSRAGGGNQNQNHNQNREHSQNQNQSQRGQLSPPHPQGPPAPTTNPTRSLRGGKGNHLQAGWILAQHIFCFAQARRVNKGSPANGSSRRGPNQHSKGQGDTKASQCWHSSSLAWAWEFARMNHGGGASILT